MFNNSVDKFIPDLNSVNSSCARQSKDNFALTISASSRQPSVSGHAAQILNHFSSGYLNRQVSNPDKRSSLRSLNDFSVSHPPPRESDECELIFTELYLRDGPGDYAEIISSYYSDVLDDGFPFTPLTSATSPKTAHPSLRSVAKVEPSNKVTQQRVLTDTARSNANKSCDSGKPVPPAQVHVAGIENTGQANPTRPAEHPLSQAKKQAKYMKSEKDKETIARYDATERKKHFQRERSARYRKTLKGKQTLAEYARSPKGKFTVAIKNARYNAYNKAINAGYNPEYAREQGRIAAEKTKQNYQK